MAQFFINRPVFAWVIAISIIAGGFCLPYRTLSISQYPEIAPPTVRISATYPGASAETVENAVTKVIEQNMKRSRQPRLYGVVVDFRWFVIDHADLLQQG